MYITQSIPYKYLEECALMRLPLWRGEKDHSYTRHIAGVVVVVGFIYLFVRARATCNM